MNMEVVLGGRPVGDGHPCFVIAEIGINHNGDTQMAEKLIDVAALAGCEAVKFQKRTVDVVYSAEELAKPRESPFGETNGDLKRGLEFGQAEYEQIDRYCRRKRMRGRRPVGTRHRSTSSTSSTRPSTRSRRRRSPTMRCFSTPAPRASRSSFRPG